MDKIHLKNRDISTLKAYGFNQILAACNTDFDTQKAAMLNLILNATSSGINPILGMRHFIQYFGIKDEIDFDDKNMPILSDEQYQTMLLRLFSERYELATSSTQIKALKGKINDTYIGNYNHIDSLNENSEELCLHHTSLPLLPNNLSHLVNVKTLRLSHTNLKSLPPEIAELRNLEKLFINGTDIQMFPEAICSLKNLKTLSLSLYTLLDGKKIEIPKKILELKNLEHIDITFPFDSKHESIQCKGKDKVRNALIQYINQK